MTTLSPDAAPETTDETSPTRVLPRVPRLRGLGALREALDRPLSSYYLLLGASTLLLTIGLMMVLSSSSVDAYKTTGDSYAIVKRQLMWVLLGEMFPNSIRATALGVGSMANWIANFIVTVSFPSLAAVSLTLSYGIFAAFALISFFFVLAKIPETKGRSLEEMGVSAVESSAGRPAGGARA